MTCKNQMHPFPQIIVQHLWCVGHRLRRLPDLSANRAVSARKAGDANGEKGYQDSCFLGNPVSSIYTVDGFVAKSNVAVLTLPKRDSYIA